MNPDPVLPREVVMNIYQRLNAIKKDVSYIQKDKEVTGAGSYMAVTHDAVTAATRAKFVEHGVLIVPLELSSASVDSGMTTGKGNPIIRFEAKYRVQFINVDSPEQFVYVEFTAHALDQGDKAPGKAHSYATKYAVLKVLQMETGDGEEGREQAIPKEKPKLIKPDGPITPTTGVLASLPGERQKVIMDTAILVKDALTEDRPTDAYGLCEGSDFDTEEKIALWSLLDSKQRAMLKRMGEADRKTATPKTRKDTEHNLLATQA